jgi:preprotein translocase subunit SecE
MNTSQQQPAEPKAAAPLDTVLLLLAVTAVVGGIAGFYALTDQLNVTLRLALVLASFGVAAALAYQTTSGKNMWGYIRGSQVELRKTTWPARQESVTATLMIAAVVAVFAFLVWLLDSGLLWAVKQVTERG